MLLFLTPNFLDCLSASAGRIWASFEIKSAVGDKMTGGVVNDWFLAAVTTTNMTNGALCLTRPQTHIFILSDNIFTRTSPRFMTQSHMLSSILWHDLSALDKSTGEQNYVMLCQTVSSIFSPTAKPVTGVSSCNQNMWQKNVAELRKLFFWAQDCKMALVDNFPIGCPLLIVWKKSPMNKKAEN